MASTKKYEISLPAEILAEFESVKKTFVEQITPELRETIIQARRKNIPYSRLIKIIEKHFGIKCTIGQVANFFRTYCQ